jgi:acetoin utilization protein AcuC
MSKNLHISYGHQYLDWRLGEKHPTNPERATLATAFIEKNLGKAVTVIDPTVLDEDIDKLYEVHDRKYVNEVIFGGTSYEWSGAHPELGNTALAMFSGTARLVEKMLAGDAQVAFNPQGAKHHAQYQHSGGFCVFNDMAWAAIEFAKHGLKVMYIDWDAHHGDGVEALLYNTPHLTASIHDGVIYPGTGRSGHDPKSFVYNWALEENSGDDAFVSAMDEIEKIAEDYKPDIILLATGADGHETDPLSTINFTYEGYSYAAETIARIANTHCKGRVLIGGAGGYQPHTHTPRIWAQVVTDIYNKTK